MDLLQLFTDGKKVVFLDGAMGTQLAEAGFEMGGQTCLSHPDAVLAVHKRYIESGADMLITNTFTMNRINIEDHHINVDVKEVNTAGVKIAKAAAAHGQYVLGDMTSTGKMLKPYGKLAEEDAYSAFKEQATILAEAGVDGLIIETMFHLQEALCALRAAKEAASLPVIVSVSFKTANNGGRTVMGDTALDCARKLTEAGASAVGVNCGSLDPLEVAQIVSEMAKATTLPVVAQPNAGKPVFMNGQTTFNLSPEDFAAGVRECFHAGARLLGGCCGTSPAHIKAMVELFGHE
jgi:5-methyltetrahydrofolate--homocysteine methyltransferase